MVRGVWASGDWKSSISRERRHRFESVRPKVSGQARKCGGYLFSALRQHGVPSRHQPFDFQAGGAQEAGGGRQIGGAVVQRAWLRKAEQADEGSLHGVISSSARSEQTDQDLRA